MATFTFTQKAQPTEPQQLSNFGSLSVDGSHNPIPFGSGIQTVDISGSPIVSPATVSNASATTLTTPLNAGFINIITATNTLNISEADATVATKYITIPVGVIVQLPVTRVNTLYLKANTGAATVSFWYTVI